MPSLIEIDSLMYRQTDLQTETRIFTIQEGLVAPPLFDKCHIDYDVTLNLVDGNI